jgi:hypothetical protein
MQCIYVCVVLKTNNDYFTTLYEVVFIIETECVYCKVRTETLNAIQDNFVFKSLVARCRKINFPSAIGMHIEA